MTHEYVNKDGTESPLLLSILDSAHELAISTWTVRHLIRQGKLQPVKIGRRVLIERAEIARFIQTHKPSVAG